MAYLLLLISLLGPVFGDNNFFANRIIKGNPAEDGEFPFAVSIRNFWYHRCTGSIISPTWVVTAAHCRISSSFFTSILAGTVSQTYGGTKYDVLKVIEHLNYDKAAQKNDIALIQTTKKIEFSKLLKPIRIANESFNKVHTALGWGLVDSDTKEYPDILQHVDVEVIDLKHCWNVYYTGKRSDLSPSIKQLCTFTQNGAGTCAGDSGGPLISGDGYLVGILSFGPTAPCGETIPDVYTRAFAYFDWIKMYVKDME